MSEKAAFVGREEEINKLKELWEKASRSTGRFCLIAGEAGSGKSRLVEEFIAQTGGPVGAFLLGHCVQQENKIQFQPFAEIMDAYVNVAKTDLDKQKARIKEEFGELGGILAKLNPNIKELLGEINEVAALDDPQREIKRFLITCAKFFCGLANKERGMVIFIDNLQWVDVGTINLIKEMLNLIDKSNLLLIGAYREEEISPEHPVGQLLKEAKEVWLPIEKLKLPALNQQNVRQLTAGLLGEALYDAEKLADYLLEKSRGNPLFIINIVNKLMEKNALVFEGGHWKKNWELIRQFIIPDNVIDLLLMNIDKLPEAENRLLQICSLLGGSIDEALLNELMKEEKDSIPLIIGDARKRQLLERNPGQGGKLIFTNNRIAGAFLERLSDEQKKNYHLEIGKIIEEKNRGREEAVIFDLAYHYIEGGDQEKMLRYSLQAADKAKDNYANEAAISYYLVVISVLEENSQKADIRWLRAKEALAEVLLVMGRNDEVIKISQEILPLKKTPLEKASVYKKIGVAYFKKGNWEGCEENLSVGLALLGEKIPQGKLEVIFSLLGELIIHILHNLFPWVFTHKEGQRVRPEDREKIWLYERLNWLYILSNTLKFARSILRGLNITQRRIGKSKELAFTVGAYASLCMAVPLFQRALRYHEMAISISQWLNDEWRLAQTTQFLGFCYSWKGDFVKGKETLQKAREKFQKLGDMWELGMTLHGLGFASYYLADYTQSVADYSESIKVSQQLKDAYVFSGSTTSIALNEVERGNLELATEKGKEALKISEQNKLWFINCYSNINFGCLELERDNPEAAISYLEAAKQQNEVNTFLLQYTVYLYPYLAEAYLEMAKRKPGSINEKKIKEACEQALKKTRAWVTHYSLALRVKGKYLAMIGKQKEAEKYFLKSIEQAEKLGRQFEVAKGYLELGKSLLPNNKEKAKECWQQALNLFNKIGAKLYADRCTSLIG